MFLTPSGPSFSCSAGMPSRNKGGTKPAPPRAPSGAGRPSYANPRVPWSRWIFSSRVIARTSASARASGSGFPLGPGSLACTAITIAANAATPPATCRKRWAAPAKRIGACPAGPMIQPKDFTSVRTPLPLEVQAQLVRARHARDVPLLEVGRQPREVAGELVVVLVIRDVERIEADLDSRSVAELE